MAFWGTDLSRGDADPKEKFRWKSLLVAPMDQHKLVMVPELFGLQISNKTRNDRWRYRAQVSRAYI